MSCKMWKPSYISTVCIIIHRYTVTAVDIEVLQTFCKLWLKVIWRSGTLSLTHFEFTLNRLKNRTIQKMTLWDCVCSDVNQCGWPHSNAWWKLDWWGGERFDEHIRKIHDQMWKQNEKNSATYEEAVNKRCCCVVFKEGDLVCKIRLFLPLLILLSSIARVVYKTWQQFAK